MNGVRNTIDSILARVRPTSFGCWEWLGAHQSAGYAKSTLDGKAVLVHRVLYAYFMGPFPRRREADHLCRHRWCVNPLHIEPVTRRQNILRGSGPAKLGAFWLSRTHCPQGHPYDKSNTYLYRRRYRKCRACWKAAGARYRNRIKEQEHAG